jgi:hypothetical protein
MNESIVEFLKIKNKLLKNYRIQKRLGIPPEELKTPQLIERFIELYTTTQELYNNSNYIDVYTSIRRFLKF